jgi:hypothetical protein
MKRLVMAIQYLKARNTAVHGYLLGSVVSANGEHQLAPFRGVLQYSRLVGRWIGLESTCILKMS